MQNLVFPGNYLEVEQKLLFNQNSAEKIDEKVYLTQNSGELSEKNGNLRFQSFQENYFPSNNDRIIGIIEKKSGDQYQVNINAPRKAELNYLDFEGATKKNKPELYKGCIIYARVKDILKYLPITITCKSSVVKKDWNSGEALFGELKNGMEIRIPLYFARYLLHNEQFFEIINKKITLEVCIGINGLIWIKTDQTQNYIILNKFFKEAPYLNKLKAEELLYSYLNELEQ